MRIGGRVSCFTALVLLGALAPVAAGASTKVAGEAAVASAASGDGALQIRYEGTLDLEADYRRPGEIRTFHSEQTYSTDLRGRARLDWITWSEGDSARVPESFLVTSDSVFHRDAPDSHGGCSRASAPDWDVFRLLRVCRRSC